MNKLKIFGLLISGLLVFNACSDDLLEIKSQETITTSDINNLVLKYPEKAFVILNAIETGNVRFLSDFGTIGNFHDDFGVNAYKLGLDFMSNDITMTKSNWFSSYVQYTARDETSVRTQAIWTYFYKIIANMNEGIKFIPSGNLLPEVKHIKARYLAMRADSYFNLIRIYGSTDGIGVPITTETGSTKARATTAQVYAQIESDLLQAYALIDGYTRTSKEIIDKNVIAGMLARYYLQMENWSQAANYSQIALAGYAPMNNAQLMDGFNKIGNPEWIWGADVNTQTSSYYASYFSNMGNLNQGYAGLLQSFKTIDKRIFDQIPASDARKEWFVDSGNSFGLPKYSNVKYFDDTDFEGDYVYMRAGEMYLINAEANARLNPAVGKQVLDTFVQTRDPLFSASTNQATLLDQIYFQRSLELWGEGGNAFFDMKRLGKGLNRAYTGSNHVLNQFVYPANSQKFVFQIPRIEVDNNEANIPQNPN